MLLIIRISKIQLIMEIYYSRLICKTNCQLYVMIEIALYWICFIYKYFDILTLHFQIVIMVTARNRKQSTRYSKYFASLMK